MAAIFDPNKEYTISELRTLRTRYGQIQEEMNNLVNTIKAKRLVYSSKQSRSTVKKREEGFRILGFDEVLKIVTTRQEQVNSIVDKLEAQYQVRPKYGKS